MWLCTFNMICTIYVATYIYIYMRLFIYLFSFIYIYIFIYVYIYIYLKYIFILYLQLYSYTILFAFYTYNLICVTARLPQILNQLLSRWAPGRPKEQLGWPRPWLGYGLGMKKSIFLLMT